MPRITTKLLISSETTEEDFCFGLIGFKATFDLNEAGTFSSKEERLCNALGTSQSEVLAIVPTVDLQGP